MSTVKTPEQSKEAKAQLKLGAALRAAAQNKWKAAKVEYKYTLADKSKTYCLSMIFETNTYVLNPLYGYINGVFYRPGSHIEVELWIEEKDAEDFIRSYGTDK